MTATLTRNYHGQTTHDRRTGPVFCSHLAAERSNRYAYPDAPKPIHPDKEHFSVPQTLQTGTTNRETSRTTFSGMCLQSNGNLFFLVRITVTPRRTARTPTAPGTPGGDGRNRTDDPLLAKQVLYQLSYIPHS